MMLRYSIFGMELGIHGLGDYFYSPFKELNGENTLNEVSASGNNVDIENAIDTGVHPLHGASHGKLAYCFHGRWLRRTDDERLRKIRIQSV